MTTLKSELIRLGVDISDETSDLFCSGLVAILDRQREHSLESPQASLLTWWQWLLDEGYDRETMASVLSQVAEAMLGRHSHQRLLSYLKEIKAKPDGMGLLMQHVQGSYPQHLQSILLLESLAVKEDHDLKSLAGGMGKAGKDAAISVGVIGGSLLVGAATMKARSILRERAELRAHNAYENLIEQRVRDVEHLKTICKQTTDDEIKQTLSDPDSIIRIASSLDKYTDTDIEKHAELLAIKHINTYAKQTSENIKLAYKTSLEDREIELLLDPQFVRKLKKGLEKKTGQFFMYEDIEEIFDQVASNEFNKNFPLKTWQDLVKEVKKDPLWTSRINASKESCLSEAWDKVFADVKGSYTSLLSKEVEEAKDQLANKAISVEDGWIKDGEDMIKVSETKVQEQVGAVASNTINKFDNEVDEFDSSFDSISSEY